MKELFLIRHANADSLSSEFPDIDRPLSLSGYRQAHSVADQLSKKKFGSRLFISSPAIRAMTTALIFSRSGNYDSGSIKIEPSLYESDEQEYLQILRSQSDDYSSLFLFAHNPSISDLYNSLISDRVFSFATCNVAIIECTIEHWADLGMDNCQSTNIIRPENL